MPAEATERTLESLLDEMQGIAAVNSVELIGGDCGWICSALGQGNALVSMGTGDTHRDAVQDCLMGVLFPYDDDRR